MMQSELHHYLGEPIDSIKGAVLVNELDSSKHKTYRWPTQEEFQGVPLDGMIIQTDSSDQITTIMFSFEERLDRDLYDKMVETYGDPDRMFKMEVLDAGQPTAQQDFISTTNRGVAKRCSFEENPLYIAWDKNTFKIEVELDRDANRTRIVIGDQNHMVKPF